MQDNFSIIFRDRWDAGRQLARELENYANRADLLVLALPRGGVPVAYEVARALHAPLDVFLIRKLGAPSQPELAIGAIASGGAVVLNRDVIDMLKVPSYVVEQIEARELQELERREQLYREGRPLSRVQGKTVILVDDGLATGASMHAAVRALRGLDPAHIVVAVPTASIETCKEFQGYVDEIICARMPIPFHAVGAWYEDFSQITDYQVRELLESAAQSFAPVEAVTDEFHP